MDFWRRVKNIIKSAFAIKKTPDGLHWVQWGVWIGLSCVLAIYLKVDREFQLCVCLMWSLRQTACIFQDKTYLKETLCKQPGQKPLRYAYYINLMWLLVILVFYALFACLGWIRLEPRFHAVGVLLLYWILAIPLIFIENRDLWWLYATANAGIVWAYSLLLKKVAVDWHIVTMASFSLTISVLLATLLVSVSILQRATKDRFDGFFQREKKQGINA